MRERVLVTGGLGFQGFNLVQRLLNDGRAVTVVATPSQRARWIEPFLSAGFKHDARVVWGSVTDQEVMEKVVPGHDALVHMAAWASVDQSLDRPWPPFEVNAQGAMTVLEAARRFADRPLRIVVASTCEVYGPVRSRTGFGHVRSELGGVVHTVEEELVPQDELTQMLPRSPYAATKIAQDRLAYAYGVTYNMDVVILRPSNVYGPWQRHGAFGAVIPTFVRNALAGRPLKITGGGRQFREFTHVDDVVTAYRMAIDGTRVEPGEAYNVGTGETRTIRDVAVAVAGAIAHSGPIEYSDARVADVTGFLLDSSKFRAAFGWKPAVAFDDGLAGYIAWAREHGE